MQNDILFDNIYIGHSVSDAEAFAAETFTVKLASEKAEEEKTKPKKEDKPETLTDMKFMDDPVAYAKVKWELFTDLWSRDPMQAIKLVPEVTGAIGLGAVTLIGLLVGLIGGGAKAAPSKEELQAQAAKAKAKAGELKDQATDAATTGIDKAKEEVNKRTTRSAAQ
jgi:calnexin